MLMPNLNRAQQVIAQLADTGVVVSIDDFGTGFSSLARLSELRVGELKLDRLFTSTLLTGEDMQRGRALASSVISLGHALGMRVVAEGIERVELVEVLAGLACDRGQGFALHSPSPATSLDFATVPQAAIVKGGGKPAGIAGK
jgi:EAL domain-containing protein (putative c-di-GMP-specific phosphodiesterase class I)